MATQRARKSHKSRIPGRTGNVFRVKHLTTVPNIVDDDAGTGFFHLPVIDPTEIDVAHHFKLPTLAPPLLVYLR